MTGNERAKVLMQDIDSDEQTQETAALLEILAMGCRQVETDRVLSAADVVSRIRERREATEGRSTGQRSPAPRFVRMERDSVRVGQPATTPNSSTICSRILNFCGLPVAVSGISATKRTWRGTL